MLRFVRANAFWLLDLIKGKQVRTALKEIEYINSLGSLDPTLRSYQVSRTKRLLEHATRTTRYYSNFMGRTIEEFPVVNKNTIRESYDQFLSCAYEKHELVTMQTSGSTGTPFICYQNIEKKKRVYAEVLYYCEKAGYKLGDKLVYLRAITRKNNKGKIKQWMQNEELLDCSMLNKEKISEILRRMRKVIKKPGAVIIGYPSTFETILEYIDKEKINISYKINGIITSSELLHDDVRTRLTDTFNCKCFSRYANEENGFLGQDLPEQPNVFLINEANYLIEVIRLDSDDSANEGEVGRIVVTDLYNYAMPMIRYDTGDIGAISTIEVGGVIRRAITQFGGRRVDVIYDVNGNRVSPYAINNNLSLFDEISQYQFIQESKSRYTLKLTLKGELFRREELKKLLLGFLGEEAILEIETVEQIPVLSSGKRKQIVNKILSN